jgi:hypothetical protein
MPSDRDIFNIGTGRNSQRGVGLFKLSNPGVIRRETADCKRSTGTVSSDSQIGSAEL